MSTGHEIGRLHNTVWSVCLCWDTLQRHRQCCKLLISWPVNAACDCSACVALHLYVGLPWSKYSRHVIHCTVWGLNSCPHDNSTVCRTARISFSDSHSHALHSRVATPIPKSRSRTNRFHCHSHGISTQNGNRKFQLPMHTFTRNTASEGLKVEVK